ncbi:MAG TPA: hypothetical protein ENJ95_20645 [Bacteroidetes bacterium]|nr:hypothetical protein [Bacteroidota bacterium]
MKQTTLFLLLFFITAVPSLFSQQTDFYETDKIQDIKITFAEDNWRYVLDSLRFNGDGYLEGEMEINGQKFAGAGIQYRNTKSFSTGARRNSFNIVLDHKNKEQNLQGYTALKLSNALRDPSLVREVLGYEIARSYMPAPKANYARLNINGEYYGLMVNIEPVEDAKFRERLFGVADNSFFKAKEVLLNEDVERCKKNIYGSLQYDSYPKCYDNNFEKLSEHGTRQLIRLTKTLNKSTDQIESILNVDETLWMLAFNNATVNLLSYSGHRSINYYLYQDKNSRFSPIIGDLNLSFGSYKNTGGGSDLRTRKLISLDPLLHQNNPSKPLISKLLSIPKYKKMYLSHLRSIANDYFINGKYLTRAKELQQMIKIDVMNDQNKFYETSDFNNSLDKVIGKKSKIPGIKWLMSRRADFLKKHPSLAVFPPEISNVEVARRQAMSSKKVADFKITAKVDRFPKKVNLLYRFDSGAAFSTKNMKAKDGGMYEVTIVPENGEGSIEYYIIAENASMIGYSPANYMWEQYSATLEELNK